jgi:hypothetical protein
MGVPLQAFYRCKRHYAGLGLNELRELRQLREENRKFETLVAGLTLDKHILQDVLSKKSEARGASGAGVGHRRVYKSRSSLCQGRPTPNYHQVHLRAFAAVPNRTQQQSDFRLRSAINFSCR